MRPELPWLIKSRAKIAIPGNWGKGMRRVRLNFSSYCAAEAIEETVPYGPIRGRCFEAIHRAADTESISKWNDAPERTHTEVLAVFDKAIGEAS